MGEAWTTVFDTHSMPSGLALGSAVSSQGINAISAHASDSPGGNALTQGLTVAPPCRVLVVDDDPLVRTRLSALLIASQYQVEVAATGQEALRIMDTAQCHIVLTDWQMPDMDGLALCRHVRHKIQESYVYVLMLTIRDTESDVLTGLAAGVDAYVVKGTPIDEILARLEIGRRICHGKYSGQTRNSDDWGLSYKDPVTGVLSLNYLMEYLPRELTRSQRYGHALAVLNCRIDGFNRFAERFGHEAGDEQLRSFAINAEASIRKCDWLARTLGDSFMIVLPETTKFGADRAAQKLRALFAMHPLSTPAEPMGFTVSIEVTALNAKHDAGGTMQVEALLRTASGRTNGNSPLGEAQSNSHRLASVGAHRDGRNDLN
jgi:two-component system cell cycle response regulator